MKRLLLLAALASAGCYSSDGKIDANQASSQVNSFKVEVRGLYSVSANSTNRSLLPVVNSCAERYGNQQEAVPAAERGTVNCRYAIPKGMVDIDLAITALDRRGETLSTFEGPVSFRVVPGDLTGLYGKRWTRLTNGEGTGTVRVHRLYGDVRVWVQDEPPQLDFTDGGVRPGTADGGPDDLPPLDGEGSYATGLATTLYFEEPTLSSMQEPDTFDSRGSPFAGQFLTVGRPPESGAPLVQSCPPGYDPRDPTKKDPNDGKLVTMVVTGTDPGGFFVTDLTACRKRESTAPGSNVRTPEPSGFLPGHYGSTYVYNYSFPEGLYPGDLLWSISGSVQDFAATTQLTFPSWVIRERVRELPPAEWEKYLSLVPVVELNGRHCGLDNVVNPYVTDALCGYSYGNMKMESMESSLVKLRRVRMPQVFRTCDANGNNTVPFFCPGQGGGAWTTCFEDPPNDPDVPERQCAINCTVGLGEYAGKICAERTQYTGFGQYVVEMAGPGPREAGLDDSLDRRTQVINVSLVESRATTTALTTGINGPSQVRVWCDTPVRVRFGPANVRATIDDAPLAAKVLLEHTMTGTEQHVAVLADGDVIGKGQCHVSINSRIRIAVVTRDAVPDLEVDCQENDPNAAKARQCRLLRAATYNITGHLRQVSAARPRWIVYPRDLEDVCCFPGPEGQCPSPLQQCPAE